MNDKEREPVFTATLSTPLGSMLAGATAKGLCSLEFSDRADLEARMKKLMECLPGEFQPGTSPYFELLSLQLNEYFSRKRKTFDLPLVMAGTPFQQKVWKALQSIPYSSTRTYWQQAEVIGSLAAIRAVAKANGDNHLAILIPCHRVIGANGNLTGYSGGLWRKQFLLDLEKQEHQEALFS